MMSPLLVWKVVCETELAPFRRSIHSLALKVMREALRRGQVDGNLPLVRQLTGEIGVWFDGHAKSMDAVLAMYLKEVQYDPITRIVHKPQERPEGAAPPECGVPLDETQAS